jgi:hypothetical protein
MEIWNSYDETVETVTALLPQEIGRQNCLDTSMMTSINKNTELVITGGWATTFISEIWKYTYASNTWEMIGNLKTHGIVTLHFLFNKQK